MRVLKAVGKQGASVMCVSEVTKIKQSDVVRFFDILTRHKFL